MKRKLYEKLLQHLERKEYTILTGGRQTGKTTLLGNLRDHCQSKGLPNLFINLENKLTLAELDANPMNLLKFLPTREQKTFVFLDEIQLLSDPSNFLKLLFDEHRDLVKVVASGSSAFYIDQKFNDSLAGRKRVFQLFTCDFEEFLTLQGKEELWQEVVKIRANSQYKSLAIDLLRLEWESYVLYGGYPAVLMEPDINEKREILKEIRDAFVKRDISESGVQNDFVFYQLFKILAAQTGQLVNVNELANTLRVRNETISSYLGVLEKCFHVTLVKPFFANLRKELVKMPKCFLMDTGLRNCLLNNFSPIQERIDKGELWEQVVFRLLFDKFEIDSIRYWRTADGNEVDFVLPDLTPPLAIEAKFDAHLAKPNKYTRFKEAYPDFDFKFAVMNPWSEDFFRFL